MPPALLRTVLENSNMKWASARLGWLSWRGWFWTRSAAFVFFLVASSGSVGLNEIKIILNVRLFIFVGQIY